MSDQPQPAPEPLVVRRTVVERYGARARAALAAERAVAAAGACCEPAAPAAPRPLQFLTLEDDAVDAPACDPSDPNCAVGVAEPAAFGAALYGEDELAALPEGA